MMRMKTGTLTALVLCATLSSCALMRGGPDVIVLSEGEYVCRMNQTKAYIRDHVAIRAEQTSPHGFALRVDNRGEAYVPFHGDNVVWVRFLDDKHWSPLKWGPFVDWEPLGEFRSGPSTLYSRFFLLEPDMTNSVDSGRILANPPLQAGDRIKAYVFTGDGFLLKESDPILYDPECGKDREQSPTRGDGLGITIEDINRMGASELTP
jgi:hypothetical protein